MAKHPRSFDEQMMLQALEIARRGLGRVEPNPMVGCIIVRNGCIIAKGWHRKFGGPHAEIDALLQCKGAAQGATVYVTLEPCCHYGMTPPCTKALIQARVARVVFPMFDPNPQINGQGARELTRAGITVEHRVLEADAARLMAPFLTLWREHRPYIIAKWAQSLDGRFADQRGQSQWISCEESRNAAHRLRARVDAIIVGSGTVKADDPLLTAREAPIRRRASRVVLDRRLRMPIHCWLVKSAAETPVLLATTPSCAKSNKAERLRKLGVEVVGVPSRNRFLHHTMKMLGDRGWTNALVEGGPTLLTSMLREGLVDEIHAVVAPIILGGSCGFMSMPTVAHGALGGVRFGDGALRRSGVDWLLSGRMTDPLRFLS